MTRALGFLAIMGLGAAGLGCSDRAEPAGKTYGGRGRVASTSGGAVVLTYDERVAVATHRTSGVISVSHLDPTRGPDEVLGGKHFELDVGVNAQPWAAVIGADDNTAYVLLRGSQEVVRITGLHERPKLERAGAARVGTDPTDLAITPSGARLYVANFGEGTVSMITTSNLVAQQYTDLNFALAQTGVLGGLTEEASAGDGIWTDAELRSVRPGLAHPRALAMTDSGDEVDEDETLYATEFYSQSIPGTQSTDPDQQRQGFVYAVSLLTGQLQEQEQNPIPLGPVSTGIPDAESPQSDTFCFPNQLYSAAVEGNRLYVTSMCASPRGPVGLGPSDSTANFQTLVHPAVFVVDTSLEGQREIPALGGVLTKKLADRYLGDPTVADRRMPLIPNDIAVVPGSNGPVAYVTAFGADAVFPIDYASGAPEPTGFVDLRPAGRLPIGIVASRNARQPFALVLNDYSDLMSVVSLADGRVVDDAIGVSEPLADQEVREGRLVFATGLEIWSFQGVAHSSCESCHPEGGSDAVVWRFPRGPRRTISTAGTYFPDQSTRRMLLWTANVDEIHDVEVIARTVSGGVGGVLWNTYTGAVTPNKDCRLLYDGNTASVAGGVEACPGPKSTGARLNGLNGSLGAITRETGSPPCSEDALGCDINASQDWDRIDAFIRSLRAPKAPRVCPPGPRSLESACLDADLVEDGRVLFARAQCGGCHGGPGWTISKVFYTPNLENNGRLPPSKPMPAALDAAGTMLTEMRGRLRAESYLAGGLSILNPPAASGEATFRNFAPASGTVDPAQAALDFLYGSADQINCVLRDVGTFPPQLTGGMANTDGIEAPGVTAVEESRRNLVAPAADAPPGTPATYQTTLAVGKDGFNIPTLVGLGLGGPFFHAGGARTLEEAFGAAFAAHHATSVFAPDLVLSRDDVRALVSYLLSIDDDTDPVAPATANVGVDPDLCAQWSGG